MVNMIIDFSFFAFNLVVLFSLRNRLFLLNHYLICSLSWLEKIFFLFLASVGFVLLFFHSFVVDAVPEADGAAVAVGFDRLRGHDLGRLEVFTFVVGGLAGAWLKSYGLNVKVLESVWGLSFQDDVAGSGILQRHHGLRRRNWTRSLRQSAVSTSFSPLAREPALKGPLRGFWWGIIVQILLIIVIICLIQKFNWFTPQHLGRPSRAQKIRGEASTSGNIIAVLPEKLGLLQIRSNIRGVLGLWHGNLRVRPRMQNCVGLPFYRLVRASHINYNLPIISSPKPIGRQRLLLVH